MLDAVRSLFSPRQSQAHSDVLSALVAGDTTAVAEQRSSTVSQPQSWLVNTGGTAGVVVTPKSSLTYSVVYACVDLIASTIAMAPLGIYERKDGGRYPADEHDQWYLLKKQPHKMYSRFVFWRQMIAYLMLWGDAFAKINRDGNGRPTSYTILDPWNVQVQKIKSILDGQDELLYNYSGESILYEDILHISDLSIDGKRGCSRITSSKATIGQGLAMINYGNEVFEAGTAINGYIYSSSGDHKLNEDAYKVLVDRFANGYGSNRKVGVLPLDFKYEQFKHPLPAADVQYIESRRFTKEEVYTLFKCPGFLVGDTGKVNNSIAESLYRSFLGNTIAPITTMIELELDRKIFRPSERQSHYVKYNLAALDKADFTKTIEGLEKAVNNSLMTINEARSVIDRNPVEGGDELRQPLNMATLSVAQQIQQNGNTGAASNS